MRILTNNTAIKAQSSVSQALHTLLSDKSIGFTQIPDRTNLLSQSKNTISYLTANFSQFVVIGIGGSSMGPRTLVEMSFVKNIHFLDNVDSVEFDRIWVEISQNKNFKSEKEALAKTAFILISKSGTTIEVLWNFSALENKLNDFGLKIIDQSIFITESVDNELSVLAKKNARPILEIPLDVGGRYSVLTPVGLVIAGLCGYSLDDLYAGARLALADKQNVVETCSLFLNSFKRHESITLFWFYNSNYRWFGCWLQQLWAESLGKKTDRHGNKAGFFSSPFIAIGGCDQHSILQQVAHGTEKNKFVCFFNFTGVEKSNINVKDIRFKDIQFMQGRNYGDLIASQSKATEKALAQNNVSTASFTVNDENKSMTLGYLFMYFQLVVATISEHENINAFDQPGVALGKEIALQMLKKS